MFVNACGKHRRRRRPQDSLRRGRRKVECAPRFTLPPWHHPCLIAAIWNSFGPVADSLAAAFGWTDATIALINILCITAYVLATPACTWIMDVKGLRVAMLFSCTLLALGAALRCITTTTPAVTWLCVLCALCDGAGGPVAFGGIALVSAVWFPARERVAATAVTTCANGMGVSATFLLAPALVPSPRNTTLGTPSGGSHSSAVGNHTNTTNIEEIQDGFMTYMYIMAGACAFGWLATVVYFPARPQHAPSRSAAATRTGHWAGVKDLLRNKLVWGFGGTYAVSNGVYNAWMSVLTLNLTPLGLSQADAGYVGFVSFTAGMVATVAVGLLSAVFARRMKLFLLLLYTAGTASLVVFSLVAFGIIPTSQAVVYVTVTLASVCLCGAVPLFFELACEVAYPVAEGATNGLVTLLQNVMALLFLLGLLHPQAGTLWMSWCVAAATAVCVPCFLLFSEDYRRLDVDVAWTT